MTTPDLRVAFITGNCRPTVCGVGDFTLRLSDALVASGVSSRIWTRQVPRAEGDSERPPRVVGVVRTWRAVEAVRFVAARWRWPPHVTHLQYEEYAFHFRWGGFAAFLASAPKRVLTLHEPRAASDAERRRQRMLVRAADAVVVNDEETASYVRDLGGPSVRIETIGIGSNVVAAPLGKPVHEPGFLLSFGIVKPDKGLECLIEAYSALRGLLHDRQMPLLLVAGSAPSCAYPGHLSRRAEELGVGASIRFLGELSDAELATLLRDAVACVLPFPDGPSFRRTTLHSAWRYGCPTVTTPSSSPTMRGLVLAAASHAPTHLADAIARVLTDQGLRARVSAAGRAVAARFEWPNLAARHAELYRSLVAA